MNDPVTLDQIYYRRRQGNEIPGRIIYIIAHGIEPPPILPWVLYRPDLAASPYLHALAGLRVRIWSRYPDLTIRRFRTAIQKLPLTRVSVALEDLNASR